MELHQGTNEMVVSPLDGYPETVVEQDENGQTVFRVFVWARSGADIKAAEEWANINGEDEGVCRRMQEGRRCDAYDGGRLAPYWDVGTAHFHRQIANAILAKEGFARTRL